MEMKFFVLERNNLDKRKDKIIHPFDGRLTPLYPEVLEKCSFLLASKLALDQVDYIVGFAEGGILSSYGVSAVTKIPFVGSYRMRLKATNEITFVEPHSARPQHYVYGLKPGDRIVIIEDEISTGNTLYDAIRNFIDNGIMVVDVGSFILACGQDNEIIEKIRTEYQIEIKYLYDRAKITP